MKFGRKIMAAFIVATSVFTAIPVQIFGVEATNNIKVELTDEQEYNLHIRLNEVIAIGADGKAVTTESEDLMEDLYLSPGVLPVGKANLESILSGGVGSASDVFKEDIFVDIKEGYNIIEFEYRGKNYKVPEIYGMAIKTSKATDLNKNKWYYSTVVEVLNRGLMGVDAAGRFNPDAIATLEDVVEVSNRLAIVNGFGTGSFDRNSKHDIIKGKYAKTDKLMYLKVSGANRLLGNGLHDGNSISLKDTKLTRKDLAQFAVILPSTIAKVELQSTSKPYIKDEKACWVNPSAELGDTQGRQVSWSVYAVVNNNIMSLDEDRNFNPNKQVTKAELATVVFKLDNLIKTKGTTNKIANGYTDPKAGYTRFPAWYEGHDNWLIRD